MLETEGEIPLQRVGGFAYARGANDQAHAVRQLQRGERFFQLGAIVALDAAGNTAGTRVVRHQHQIAAREADEGGQGGAFVATFFFVYLNDDFLAFAQHL